MMRLFALAEKRHAEIVKEANPLAAVGGLFGRAALTAGKAVASRPGTALGAALSGAELAGGVSRGAGKTQAARAAAQQVSDSAPHIVSQGMV